MRRVIATTTSLSALFTLVELVTIFIGYRQQPPPYLTWLRLNECQLPCWLGIIPGQTTIGEAQQRIKASYGLAVIGSGNIIEGEASVFTLRNTRANYKLSVAFNGGGSVTDDTIIQDIWLAMDETSPYLRIGDLYSILGNPQFVYAIPGSYVESYIYYADGQAGLTTDRHECGKITAQQPALTLQLTPYTQFDRVEDFDPWRSYNQCHERDY